jgi:hypothetical protein
MPCKDLLLFFWTVFGMSKKYAKQSKKTIHENRGTNTPKTKVLVLWRCMGSSLQRRNECVIAYKGMQESYDIYESMNALQLEIGTERARNQEVGDETEEERMHVQDVRYVERVRRVSVTLPLPTFFFEKNLKKS